MEACFFYDDMPHSFGERLSEGRPPDPALEG